MVGPGLSVQSESGTILVHAVETAAFLKLVPGGAGHSYVRTRSIYALDEVLVAANMIAAQKSLDS